MRVPVGDIAPVRQNGPVHIWIHDHRKRARAYDASAGAPGERGVPAAGGVNPEESDFEAAFDANRSRIRLRSRDQETNQQFGAELYLPAGGRGYDSGTAKVGDAAIGDAALRDLVTPKGGCEEISGLAAWQRLLDAHYGQ
jgi:hypothetical protein